MKKIIAITSLLLFITSGIAVAAEKKSATFKPDMRLIFKYTKNLKDDSSASNDGSHKYTLERMYLGLKAKPTENVTFRGTLDVKYDSTTKVKKAYFKYGYADIKKLLPGMVLTFGQQKTGLIDFEGKIWGHRDVAKVGLDLFKFDTSADMGLAIRGKLPSKLGGFHIGLFSGEGYKADTTEDEQQKAFSARLNLTPFASSNPMLKKLMLTAYFKTEWKSGGADNETLFGGILSFQCKSLSAAVEYFTADNGTTTSSLLSAYATFYAIPKKLGIFARIDMQDPDTDVDDNEFTYIILGAKYFLAKRTSVALALTLASEKSGTTTSKQNDVSLVFDQKF